MELRNVLNENIIDLHMKVASKDEAFYHLASLLQKEGYIHDIEAFIQDIYLREAEGITGIGNHIAIPHGKSKEAEKIGIAIGRCEHPIPWESIDERPVSLIFLFCVSNNADFAKNHMMMLAKVAGRLGNDHIIEALLKATAKEEIIALLCDQERSTDL